jgi:hypothetical protein
MAVGGRLDRLREVRILCRPIAAMLVAAGVLCSCSSSDAPAVTPAPRALSPSDFATPAPPKIGLITFGKGFDKANERAQDVRTQFKATDPGVAWSAAFTESVGTPRLDLVISSRSSTGVETVLVRKRVTVRDPSAQVVAVLDDLAKMVDRKPGKYVMRYYRDANILAEGTFAIVK